MPPGVLDLDAMSTAPNPTGGALDLDAIQAAPPEQGVVPWLRGAAQSVINVPMGMARQAGYEASMIPTYIREPKTFLGDLWRGAQATASAAPEIGGGTLGGILGGPAGVPLGAAMGRELVGIAQGLPAEQRGEQAGGAFLSTLIGQRAPQVAEAVGKIPGRYLSLPAERHAAGAAMLEKIPERFGVTDDLVEGAYAKAERLAKNPPTQQATLPTAPRVTVNASEVDQAVSRLLGRGMKPEQAAVVVTRNFLTAGATVEDVVPLVNKSVSSAAGRTEPWITPEHANRLAATVEKPTPPPGAPTSRPASLNASLGNFQSRLEAIRDGIRANPIEPLRDKALLKNVSESLAQAKALKSGANPQQLDGIIKAVNTKIRQAPDGATEGAWKHILGGLHEDLRQAAVTTGDPAFTAYAEAIDLARLNFLRRDIETLINRSGIREQRTGKSVITSPGAVEQWMKTHPDWAEKVEKARPGLIETIRQDLEEIKPITDIVGRGMPGQSFGSGRFALGMGTGALLSKVLGLDPFTISMAGGLLSGLWGKAGFDLPPAYIQRSFRPGVVRPSISGAGVGAVMAPAIGAESGSP